MQLHDWHDPANHALACELMPATDVDQLTCGAARLWIAFNPGDAPVGFTLALGDWMLALDSSGVLDTVGADQTFLLVPAHALVVLRHVEPNN
jgi:hypothetical protein